VLSRNYLNFLNELVNITKNWCLPCGTIGGRPRWPRSLRRGAAAALLARIAVWNPARLIEVSLSYEFCVLSGKGLCDRPIPRAEEFYWMYVCVSLSVIRRNSNPVLQQWLGTGGQTRTGKVLSVTCSALTFSFCLCLVLLSSEAPCAIE